MNDLFRNRKFCKIAMGGPQPQVCGTFAVIFLHFRNRKFFLLLQTWTANFAMILAWFDK